VISTAVHAGFVYDVYLSDGSIHEQFPYWALLKPGDELDVDHQYVHVERVLRVEGEHYVVYATRDLIHH
jgi:hypothetical protein